MNIEQSVIEQMVRAHWYYAPISSTSSESRMRAAAEVLADKLLGPVTDEEWIAFQRSAGSPEKAFSALIASRRALIAPKPTLEARISAVIVNRFGTGSLPADKLAAEIIALMKADATNIGEMKNG